jgi:hypothetical protein
MDNNRRATWLSLASNPGSTSLIAVGTRLACSRYPDLNVALAVSAIVSLETGLPLGMVIARGHKPRHEMLLAWILHVSLGHPLQAVLLVARG